MLKILEEPPADCIFILLTSRRNAVLPTILSRVRTYNFKDRVQSSQTEVIQRVFHNNDFNGSISEYVYSFEDYKDNNGYYANASYSGYTLKIPKDKEVEEGAKKD